MLIFLIVLIILFFCCFWCFLYIFSIKKDIFCTNFVDFKKNYDNNKIKFEYKKLNKSSSDNKLTKTFRKIKKPMFTEKFLIKNKKFLLAISKFIDYKINNCKLTFRTKKNDIIIEKIAKILINDIIKNNRCELFNNYKKLCKMFSIKKKEDKMFKFLISKQLILLLCTIEDELCCITRIIQKSKHTKKIRKFKKKILFSAQIYSIKKFNENSTKLLKNFDTNLSEIIDNFLAELIVAEKKIKIIITYLTVMFS
jgi:hypothetical protein